MNESDEYLLLSSLVPPKDVSYPLFYVVHPHSLLFWPLLQIHALLCFCQARACPAPLSEVKTNFPLRYYASGQGLNIE